MSRLRSHLDCLDWLAAHIQGVWLRAELFLSLNHWCCSWPFAYLKLLQFISIEAISALYMLYFQATSSRRLLDIQYASGSAATVWSAVIAAV